MSNPNVLSFISPLPLEPRSVRSAVHHSISHRGHFSIPSRRLQSTARDSVCSATDAKPTISVSPSTSQQDSTSVVTPVAPQPVITTQSDDQFCDGGPSVHAETNPSAAFFNYKEYLRPITVEFSGSVPSYLDNAVLYRLGLGRNSATFSDGTKWNAPHPFEFPSMATLIRISTSSNTVTMLQRLNSQHFLQAIEERRPEEFTQMNFNSTDRNNIWEMLRTWKMPSVDRSMDLPFINYGVTCERLPGFGLVARTDGAYAQQLDTTTLRPGRQFKFDKLSKELNGFMMSTSHGVWDSKKGEYYNIVWDMPVFDGKSTYKVFKMPRKGGVEVIGTFKQDTRFLHSFAVTQNYVIIILNPTRVNPAKFVLSWSLGDSLEDINETRMVVIHRFGRGVVANYVMKERFSSMHVVNAFENRTGDIFIDVPRIVHMRELANATTTGMVDRSEKPPSPICRIRLPNVSRMGIKDRFDAEWTQVSKASLELPQINPRWAGNQNYRFVYGNHFSENIINSSIRKIDLGDKLVTTFKIPGMMVDEPYFVADPNGINEEDGVLLVMGFDTSAKKSTLFILDPKDMSVRAKAEFGVAIPQSFHWYLDENDP